MIEDFLKQHGDYRDDQCFKQLTTLKMGGLIRHYVEPYTIEDLKAIVAYLKQNHLSFKVLGNGSNLVCGSSIYEGVVICLKHLDAYTIENDLLYVQAGAKVMHLAQLLAKEGYSCLEFASGIPGSVGGLVYMNAGAYKRSMSDVTVKVRILKDDELVWLDAKEMNFSYRNSILSQHPHWVVVEAVLKLEKKDSKEILALMADRLARRKQSQPLQDFSAGSCFRNPGDVLAWQLIDGIGYRGYKLNGVEVSSKHSNFIVNKDGGSGEDYLAIAYDIQDKVKEKYGIQLTMEVEKFNC